jgi:CubicO group peptidase (beta-lactamase class C family)
MKRMKCDHGHEPSNPSRRRFGCGLAAAALAASTPALGGEHPVIEPRAPMTPRPFTFRVNGSPESVGLSRDRLKRIDAAIQRMIDAGQHTGAVTAVARRGELVHYQAHGYANIQTKAPMPLDAIFRMASSSKPVTGVALLMLVEEQKVRLHDPVSRYIPEFRNMKVAAPKAGQPSTRVRGAPPREMDLVPAERPITLLDLATHTSGLLSGGPGAEITNIQRGPDDTLATYVPRLAAAPLDFQPGLRWQYSGGAGIDTLARVVEIASGKDFDTFIRERIFEPLGMADTHFNVPAAKRSRALPMQRKVNGEWQVTPFGTPGAGLFETQPTKYFSGAGGLFSTCRDYLLFEQMLVNRGELNGRRLLSSRTVELMGANQVGDTFHGPIGGQDGMGFGITVGIVLDSPRSKTGLSNGAFGWGGALGTRSWNDRAEEIAAVIMLQQPNVDLIYDFEMAIRQAIID